MVESNGETARARLARYGTTFRLAGRLLPSTVLTDAAELYSFCRVVDDLADTFPIPETARAELLGLQRALLDGDYCNPLAAQLLRLHTRTGICVQAAATLVETVLSDLNGVRIADEAALLRYAYGVAGTVGRMMCGVLGAQDARAAPHAIDLGIAMQLTNIARDVIEDAASDRIYLPATWLPPAFGPGQVADTPVPVFAAVKRLLVLADQRYRSAELGYRYLPRRVRPAIQGAARLYEEIGLQILRRGPGYLSAGRCVVPQTRKLALLVTCLFHSLPSGPHDKLLHGALAGCPGAHA